jgi:hypothetical protein
MNLVLKLISSPWFWADIVLSVSGGVIVYWGLIVEKKAEKNLPPEDFNPDIFEDILALQKKEVERGWRILMTGIVVEVVAALGISVISSLEIANLTDKSVSLSFKVEELRQANDEIEAKQIRSITLQQRDKFINLVKNYPKCPVRVFIQSEEWETKIFAQQIREMLDDAGYGFKNGKDIEKVDVASTFSIGSQARYTPLVFVFLGKNGQDIIRPSFEIHFHPDSADRVFWGTNDASGAPGMISDAFLKIGIKPVIASSETFIFLKPGEWGVFVPQKF